MDRERLDNWCEKAILGLVLAILVVGPLMLGGVRASGFLVLQVLTMLVMVVWGVRLWVNPRAKLLWPPISWAVLAFVVYAIVRYCQADIEWVARRELIRVLVYAFLFFAILNNLHRQESTQVITSTLVFLGMAISVYAIFQLVTKSHKIWWMDNPYYPGRAGGTFIYPNNLAGFLEMLVPLGLCLVLIGRVSHVAKIFVAYAVLVMLAGIAVTFSRGGWMVTGVVMMATCGVLLFQRDYRLKALVLLGALIVAGICLAPKLEVVEQRVRKMTVGGNVDDSRFSLWWSAIKMWRDNVWWGVGPGHFDYRYSQYRLPDMQMHAGYAHNDYLNTLADWGVAGTALVVAAWALLGWGIVRCWKFVRGARDDFARKRSSKFAFLIGASLALLAILLHSLVDFNMQAPANAILVVTLMALVSSQWRFATERFWFSGGLWLKCVATLVLLGGLAELGRVEWQGAQEWVWLHRAEKTPNFSYARIAALEKAFAVDPKNFETTYAIGECYKIKSFQSESDDPNALARQAMTWYERGMKLNPYDAYNWMRYGMCLDWIGPDDKGVMPDSSQYYQRANELDPNGFFTTANTGWHYVQTGDYAAARTWFDRSRRLNWENYNDIGPSYMPIVERRLQEDAVKQPVGMRPPTAPTDPAKP